MMREEGFAVDRARHTSEDFFTSKLPLADDFLAPRRAKRVARLRDRAGKRA